MQLNLICPPKIKEHVMKLHFNSHTYAVKLVCILLLFPLGLFGWFGRTVGTQQSLLQK